jgi:hypothetical protein
LQHLLQQTVRNGLVTTNSFDAPTGYSLTKSDRVSEYQCQSDLCRLFCKPKWAIGAVAGSNLYTAPGDHFSSRRLGPSSFGDAKQFDPVGRAPGVYCPCNWRPIAN